MTAATDPMVPRRYRVTKAWKELSDVNSMELSPVDGDVTNLSCEALRTSCTVHRRYPTCFQRIIHTFILWIDHFFCRSSPVLHKL